MTDFYDLIDNYAEMYDRDKNDVLHEWYRSNIDCEILLTAWLNNEGIFGYSNDLIAVLKALGTKAKKDGRDIPWAV